MSQRIQALENEIMKLRSHFLPDPFDPLGQYSDPEAVQANTRAFLVLSHAEIETFIEGWAKDIAKAAEKVWDSKTRVARPLAFLLAALDGRIKLVDSLTTEDSETRFSTAIAKIFLKYYNSITTNHGIKESNVLKLFDPIGVPAAAFNATLLPALNSLGSDRGKHAHSSGRSSVISVLDPEVEFKRLESVLSDLSDLDSWLVTYKRKIR